MKKILNFICVILACLICMTGCGVKDEPTTTIYDTLNSLITKEYSSITLTVKTTTDGETLNGSYNVRKQEDIYIVTYSYEKLNGFEEVGGVIIPPAEYKSIVDGSIKIRDGAVIEQNGTPSNITIESLTVSGLKFKESYFTNVTNENNIFKASVDDVDGFFSCDVNLTDLNVEITYTIENIKSIKLKYSTKESSVELIYNL